jgi:RIO kinase 1
MYTKAHLVHADLSSYNILFWDDTPYFIDVGQAVLLQHPQAHAFLQRDLHNLAVFFHKFNITLNEHDLFTTLTQST